MLLSPFPYFGGKRSVAEQIWKRLGSPSQYIEPFCGSAAVLLAAPRPASLDDLPGWDAVNWDRGRLTYAGGKTTAEECVWYSPACLPAEQTDLFSCRSSAEPLPTAPNAPLFDTANIVGHDAGQGKDE